MWSGEEDFKPLLQKALQKPSKGSLAAVTDVAVRDEKWVGPSHEPMHVLGPLLMSRQSYQGSAEQQSDVFFAVLQERVL